MTWQPHFNKRMDLARNVTNTDAPMYFVLDAQIVFLCFEVGAYCVVHRCLFLCVFVCVFWASRGCVYTCMCVYTKQIIQTV